MIALDPASRPTFDAALAHARGRVLPECFYSFLHGYVAAVGERRMDSDNRIDRIWEDYASVEPHLLPHQGTPTVHHLTEDIFPVSLQIPSYTPSPRPTPAEDGPALVLLSLVLANIRNCALPSSRIRALDILLALCALLTDESKLDRAVPYVVELLRDDVAIVRAAAVRTLMQMVRARASLSLMLTSVPAHEGDRDHTLQRLHLSRVHHPKRPVSRPRHRGLRARHIRPVHRPPRRHCPAVSRNGPDPPGPRRRSWCQRRRRPL
jgi:hypothetical protein